MEENEEGSEIIGWVGLLLLYFFPQFLASQQYSEDKKSVGFYKNWPACTAHSVLLKGWKYEQSYMTKQGWMTGIKALVRHPLGW